MRLGRGWLRALCPYVSIGPITPVARKWVFAPSGAVRTPSKVGIRFAGVAYKVEGKGVVDFHSLRKTCSTRMAAADLPARIRQSAMRHSTPGLTETTYMDEDHLPVYEHVAGMERLGA